MVSRTRSRQHLERDHLRLERLFSGSPPAARAIRTNRLSAHRSSLSYFAPIGSKEHSQAHADSQCSQKCFHLAPPL
jgi:hypothetical protein